MKHERQNGGAMIYTPARECAKIDSATPMEAGVFSSVKPDNSIVMGSTPVLWQTNVCAVGVATDTATRVRGLSALRRIHER